MEFSLSDDQRALQDSLRSSLTRACPLSQVRMAVNHGWPRDPEVWAVARELGLAGLLIPEDHGGLGLTMLDAALVAEELGRCTAPVPFLGTAVLAPLALLEAGSAAQRSRWLPRMANGEVTVGVALAESLSGSRDGAAVSARDDRLDGSAMFVVDGAAADAFLIATHDGGLHWVAGDSPGLQRISLHGVDATRPMIELRLQDVASEALPGGGAATIERLRSAAYVILAADILGAGWNMIDQSVAYARARRQFGRAIGSFQAVKHMCAEMATGMEVRRALVWYAAHLLDQKPAEASLHAAHAKSQLGDAGHFVARTAVEVHGGMGITDELGLHLWFKRIALDRLLYGSPQVARRHAATLQGCAAAP